MTTKRKSWTREELLVALNLYHKLTFGQLHSRNPAIISLAEKLGRGANSLAMKLSNFAALDPVQQLRGIKGLQGASTQDRLNVRNGLCLSRLHDAAFDAGLIAFDDELRLLLSPRLKDALPLKIVADAFGAYAGHPLTFPADAIPPDMDFLRQHREAIRIKAQFV